MNTVSLKNIDSLKNVGWWLLLIICIAYAGFALDMFRLELLTLLGSELSASAKNREAPIAFLLHSVLGGVGLVCGALQFNGNILRARPKLHRTTGWTYLICIWGASLTGIWNAIYFDVPASARAIFFVIGVWWFLTTTNAYLKIRKRDIQSHRCWMIRSFAVSLFFIAFPIWVPAYQAFFVDNIAWPVGLFHACALNIAIAELWIRSPK